MNQAPDHHRRSIRLKGYDYTQAGAYYLTIVTQNRIHLFGEIQDGIMHLNDCGGIACEEWVRTSIVRPNVELDTFVIMPNHIQGIILLADKMPIKDVGANGSFAPAESSERLPTNMPHAPAPNSIGAIMMQFKSIVTKRINTLRSTPGAPIWQRNYYDHIIRNDADLERIREYIFNNPRNWQTDSENQNHAP